MCQQGVSRDALRYTQQVYKFSGFYLVENAKRLQLCNSLLLELFLDFNQSVMPSAARLQDLSTLFKIARFLLKITNKAYDCIIQKASKYKNLTRLRTLFCPKIMQGWIFGLFQCSLIFISVARPFIWHRSHENRFTISKSREKSKIE